MFFLSVFERFSCKVYTNISRYIRQKPLSQVSWEEICTGSLWCILLQKSPTGGLFISDGLINGSVCFLLTLWLRTLLQPIGTFSYGNTMNTIDTMHCTCGIFFCLCLQDRLCEVQKTPVSVSPTIIHTRCHLPLNSINSKLLVFLYVWVWFAALICFCTFCHTILLYYSKSARLCSLKNKVIMMEQF